MHPPYAAVSYCLILLLLLLLLVLLQLTRRCNACLSTFSASNPQSLLPLLISIF
jgi:hypothetical protein